MKRAWFEISWGPEPSEALGAGVVVRPCSPPPAFSPSPVTPIGAFVPLEPEQAPSDAPSPSSDRPLSGHSETSHMADWDPITTQHLSRALKVEPAFVPCETFAYSINCKAQRQQPIIKSQIEELWQLIPKSQLCRDPHSPAGRYIVFGANPRKHDCVTSPTLNLPHSFRMLCTFIRQSHPDFSFSTVSLRFNMFTKPHRDTRNAPEPKLHPLHHTHYWW